MAACGYDFIVLLDVMPSPYRTRWFNGMNLFKCFVVCSSALNQIILELGEVSQRLVCPFLSAQQERRQGDNRPLVILASLYVHIMIRRFVPSLATEMHLTIRLLHVHSEVERSTIDRVLTSEQGRHEDPSSSRHMAVTCTAVAETRLKEREDSQGGMGDTFVKNIVFSTGVDCRSFAASVLLGLKSLLPHIGTDTLDLLAESLALASQVRIGSIYIAIELCNSFLLVARNMTWFSIQC